MSEIKERIRSGEITDEEQSIISAYQELIKPRLLGEFEGKTAISYGSYFKEEGQEGNVIFHGDIRYFCCGDQISELSEAVHTIEYQRHKFGLTKND